MLVSDGAKREVFLVTSIRLDEPVIINRIEPLIRSLTKGGFKPVLIAIEYEGVIPSERLLNTQIEIRQPLKLKNAKFKSFYFRALNELYASYCLSRHICQSNKEACAILVTIPSMFLPLFFSVRSSEKVSIVDIRDLTWEYLVGRNLLSTILSKVLGKLIGSAIRRFDLVSVTNEVEREYVTNRLKVPTKRVKLVTNGITYSQFLDLCDIEPKSNKCNNLVVTYAGNVGLAQNFDVFLQAASQLPQVDFRIIGSGVCLEDIRQRVQVNGIDNVTVFGRLPWRDVVTHYKQSDILFASLNSGYTSAVPSKLYEYLASGRFVVFYGEISAQGIFSDFKGLKFVRNLKDLIDVISKAEACIDNELVQVNRSIIANKFIREHSCDKLVEKIEGLIEVNLQRP